MEKAKVKGKEKSIETPILLIKGNIMCWEGMMIQLSNVSCVSATPLEKLEFPKFSLLCLFGGLVSFAANFLVGIFWLIIGCVWIYFWYDTNEKRKLKTVLNVIMNSSDNLCFVVKDKEFLNKILRVLEQIIIDGGVGNGNVSISIKDCEFSGNAKVLTDVGIS